jgi:hypothetical protein
VGEEDDPVVTNEVMEVDGTLGGLSVEVGSNATQAETATLLTESCASDTDRMNASIGEQVKLTAQDDRWNPYCARECCGMRVGWVEVQEGMA